MHGSAACRSRQEESCLYFPVHLQNWRDSLLTQRSCTCPAFQGQLCYGGWFGGVTWRQIPSTMIPGTVPNGNCKKRRLREIYCLCPCSRLDTALPLSLVCRLQHGALEGHAASN